MSKNVSYVSWTLKELQAELKKRKIRSSGRKRELIERLEFYDRNSTKTTPAPQTAWSMSTPDVTTYLDLNADKDLPALTKTRLVDYLAQFDKKLDKKVDDLYKERYIRYVRYGRDQGHTFVKGQVWAEMRKSVSYLVDLKLDQNGIILEAQCECGAGQGPTAHCKHVSTVVFGLIDFTKTKSILTELTCTQMLQTFHRAQPYKGSPLKAESLQKLRGNQYELLYDPRSQEDRNNPGEADKFRNLSINFQANDQKSDVSMPTMQMSAPANPLAAAYDHWFGNVTPEERFLRDEMLSVITPEQRNEIEVRTRLQATSPKWMSERLKRITSSNFGTVCKSTDRRDMIALARRLTETRVLRTPAIMHGRQYESVAVEKYCKTREVDVQVCGLFVSTEHPILAASPDRVLNTEVIIEVKCPFVSKDKMITHISVPYLYTKDGKLHLNEKHDYYYQVQGQMYCSGRQMCHFVVYTLVDIVVIEIPRNDVFIKSMVEKLLHFNDKVFNSFIIDKYLYKNYFLYSFHK